MSCFLGVDTGGTFTDFVFVDSSTSEVRTHKVLSTPRAPEVAILQGMADLGVRLEGLQVIHGSTVATNAILEGKGCRTVYIGNRNLIDVLRIGRQARKKLYDLQPEIQTRIVERAMCLEVDARLASDGEVLSDLSGEELDVLRRQIKELEPEAVAINLLFSFVDDKHEKNIESVIDETVFVSRSSDVLPEYREYERGLTTFLNARVGPVMKRYLSGLIENISGASLSMMQSTGGTIQARHAARHAVKLLLSGPAGGLCGAKHVAALSGCERLLTFDMGGTSTDVSLVDGEIGYTTQGRIGDYPIAVPMVDIHTIGAGGGSIARVDEGGLLLVGPQSAGADPGPACYGKDTDKATVTDANVVLGRLIADEFLGGSMDLDVEASRTVINRIALQINVSIEQAAIGILRIANEHMARALRVISVERGYDSRLFTLVSFGGAGGLHVCALAEALAISKAIVPSNAGVLSALGLLVAGPSRERSRTINRLAVDCTESQLLDGFSSLQSAAFEDIKSELGDRGAETVCSVDARYVGQSHTLNIAWQTLDKLEQAFHHRHRQNYGHELDIAVELVNIRLKIKGRPVQIDPVGVRQTSVVSGMANAEPYRTSRLADSGEDVPVYKRKHLALEQVLQGPVLITESTATTFVDPGWNCRVTENGNLELIRAE